MELRKEWMLPVGIGIVSFAAGTTAGYIWGKRKSTEVIVYELGTEPVEVMTEEQVEHARILTQYSGVFDQDAESKIVIEPPEIVFDQNEQAAIEEVVMAEREAVELANIRQAQADGVGKFNIFEGDHEDWDYSVEVPKRGSVEPFIIHRDEFEANEEGNSQSSLTYYALDDILCDDNDVPIYNYKNIVGELIFGKGSMDPSISYVRNPRLGAEYEIILDQGSYQVEVLGEQIEAAFEEGDIKHSRHPRRMREDE